MTRRGLLIVFTGEGKGKTTASLGLVMRAWGQDLRPCVIQFIKSEDAQWGETIAAERMGIAWHTLGDGFVFDPATDSEAADRARKGWALAKEKIASGVYDLVVLDEFAYPLNFGWIDVDDVVRWLTTERPEHVHVAITGRDAPPALVDAADLVSHVQKIKHPFDDGIEAQAGIEF